MKLADLIWSNAPLTTRALVLKCEEAFEWKRTTTYTMLKRLCERGLFENDNGTVIVTLSKNDFMAAQGEQFVNETFSGSLPKFLAAFTRRKKLSQQEISEIEALIKAHKEDR